MSCCNPCGCSWRIIDTSKPKEVVPDPDPPVVEPDPPPVEMCVKHFFNPATEQWVPQLVPCNAMCVTYVFHPATEQWVEQLVPCNELP